MKKVNQKGSITILLSILVIFAIVGAGAYIYLKNKPQSPQATILALVTHTTSTTSPMNEINTSDWKTYTDSIFGLSLQYPPYMTAQENPTATSSAVFLDVYVPDPNASQSPDTNFPSIVMTISDSPSMCGDNTSTILGVTDKSGSMQKEMIGSTSFLYGQVPLLSSQGILQTRDYLQQSLPCEGIEVDMASTTSSYLAQQGYGQSDLVNAILASIRIKNLSPVPALAATLPVAPVVSVSTTTGSTAGWKTYSDYGISFQYPATWEQPQYVGDLGGYGLLWKQLLFSNEKVFITWDHTLDGKAQTIADSINSLVSGGSTVSSGSNFQGEQVVIDGQRYPALLVGNSFNGIMLNELSVYVPRSDSEPGFINIDYTTCQPFDCKKQNVSHSDVDTNTFDLLVKSAHLTN